jgi:hypothetical protein
MKQRCLNPKAPDYPLYGGKGVRVCERWMNDFVDFLSCLGERPMGMTLDRIDPTGDYTPENTKWSTPKGQAQNRRYNHKITYNGETLCLEEWGRRMDISQSTLFYRLSKLNWSIEKSLTSPVREKRKDKKLIDMEKAA